jgi:hypothetical protein
MKLNGVATGCIGAVGGILSVFIGGWTGCSLAHQHKGHVEIDLMQTELMGLIYGALCGPTVFAVVYLVILVVLSLWPGNRPERPPAENEDH